jgi:hypothetical protein
MRPRYIITAWGTGTYQYAGQRKFWTRAGALHAAGRLVLLTDDIEYTLTDRRTGKTTPL